MPIAFILSLLKSPLGRYALEALACAIVLLLLYQYIGNRGFEHCKAEYVASSNAAALEFSNKSADALSAEMIAAASLQQSHALITKTIGENHDKVADSIAPDIIRNTISSLYAGH